MFHEPEGSSNAWDNVRDSMRDVLVLQAWCPLGRQYHLKKSEILGYLVESDVETCGICAGIVRRGASLDIHYGEFSQARGSSD